MSKPATKLVSQKYVLSSKSAFWDKVRKMLTVNPDTNVGTQLPNVFRHPAPGSRMEKFQTSEPKSYDIADNAYYARDARRNFPRVSTLKQQDISSLLIAGSEAMPIAAPASGETSLTLKDAETKSLSQVLAAGKPRYSSSKLPPMAPALFKPKWNISTNPGYEGYTDNYY